MLLFVAGSASAWYGHTGEWPCVAGPLYSERTFDLEEWCGEHDPHTGYTYTLLNRCVAGEETYIETSRWYGYAGDWEYYRESTGELVGVLYCSDNCGAYGCPGCCWWRGEAVEDCVVTDALVCEPGATTVHSSAPDPSPTHSSPRATVDSSPPAKSGCGCSEVGGGGFWAPALAALWWRRRWVVWEDLSLRARSSPGGRGSGR